MLDKSQFGDLEGSEVPLSATKGLLDFEMKVSFYRHVELLLERHFVSVVI